MKHCRKSVGRLCWQTWRKGNNRKGADMSTLNTGEHARLMRAEFERNRAGARLAENRMLRQNLAERVTAWDAQNGVRMVQPNHWESRKHRLFGYATARQLRGAIRRKLAQG